MCPADVSSAISPSASRSGAMAAADQVGRADEIRDEGAVGQPVDFVRRAGLLDQPVAHHDDAVRHRQRFFQVVGHIDRGDAEPMLQLAQFDAHVGAQLGVEIGQRLVEQQHRRLEHEGARQRDALLLAAGQLRRPPRCKAVHLHHVERLMHLFRDLGRPGRAARAGRRRRSRTRSCAARWRRTGTPSTGRVSRRGC